jgi:hypothetical protein
MKIVSKKQVNQAPCWDIEVEKDHYYLLENGVISHNSSAILCGSTSPSIEPWNSNVFTQATSVGKFTFVNKRLEKLLRKYFEGGVKGDFAKYKKWKTHTTEDGKVRQGFFDATNRWKTKSTTKAADMV